MALLITPSFFVGELVIPNLTNADVLSRVNMFIEKYEPDCLKKILGYELYKALQEEDSVRIDNLKLGVEYIDDNGKTQEWIGLISDDNMSLIANYIYTKIISDSQISNTGFGMNIAQPQAAIIVSVSEKFCRAFNEFSRQVLQMINFLLCEANEGVYPEFDSCTAQNAINFSFPVNDFDI